MRGATQIVIKAGGSSFKGFAEAVYFWKTLLGFLGGCTLPRHLIPSKSSVEAFITVMAWKMAGRELPQATARVLELMFRRRFQGLRVGLSTDEVHPFSEPLTRKQVILQLEEQKKKGYQSRGQYIFLGTL